LTLRLITGDANAGKTGVVYSRMRELMAAGARPVLLLPSQPDVERAADELARDYPVGLRVTTFDRYLRSEWELRGDGRAIVTEAQRQLLCISAARDSGVSGGLGLLAADCAVTLCEQVGESWRGSSGNVGVAGETLARVLRRYARLLDDHGVVELAEATHWLAAHALPAEELLFHRFTDFRRSQETYIRAHAVGADTWVSITRRLSPSVACRTADSLIERLGPNETVVVEGGTEDTDATLSALSHVLFDATADLQAGGAVRLSLAEGSEAQAQRIGEEVARALLEGAANSGERVAVVFRNAERHAAALRRAFQEAGIEADFDVKTPFRQAPFGSAILHLLRFALNSERTDLLAALRSAFSGAEREVVRELERQWRGRGTADPRTLVADVRRVAPGFAGVVDDLREVSSGPLSTEGFDRVARAVRRLLVLGYGRTGEMHGARDELDAWAHKAVLGLLSDAARLPGSGITLADVRDALEAKGVRPRELERQGRVQVTSATRVRGRRFDTVIIGGLNAGEFPAPPAEGLLPGSAVEEVLRAFGGRGESEPGGEFEQYLFYLAVTRAKRRLVLSARSTDDDGEPVRLSPYFEIVCDSFRGPGEDEEMPPHAYRPLLQPPSAGPGAGEREIARAAALAGCREEPRLRAAARRAAPRVASLEDPGLLGRLADRADFSASEIESYLACPYGWFHAYQVRPRELERVSGAAEQGTFAHELLRETYAILRRDGVARVTLSTLGAAMEALDVAFAVVDDASGPSETISERLSRATARRWASRILSEDAELLQGFRPEHLEWAFGLEGDTVDVGGFNLRGRVDRIDLDESGRAVITDYKRSSVPTAANIVGLGKVQMPLYFRAAQVRLGVTPVAGLYRSLSKRSNRGLVLRGALDDAPFVSTDIKDAEEFDAILAAGLALAEEAVTGIRAGHIPCEPRNPAACTWCKAALVCGASR